MAKQKQLPVERGDLLVRATLLVLSFVLLGHAVQSTNGMLLTDTPDTPLWELLVSFAVAVFAAFGPMPAVSREVGLVAFNGVAAGALVANFAQMAGAWPGVYLKIAAMNDYFPFLSGVGAAAVLSGIALVAVGRLRAAAFGLLLVTWSFMGVWLVSATEPRIDVHVFQSDSARALLRGTDPYTITFPDLSAGRPGAVSYYGPGVSVNGVVQNGYVYMPLTLLVGTLGESVGGDVRYGALMAIVGTAALIAWTRPGLPGLAAALLFLSIPRSLYILEASYTEPVVVLVLAATIFCAYRAPRVVPWLLGLLLASKQYMAAAAVPSYLLVVWLFGTSPWADVRRLAGLVGKSAVAAAVVTLPFVLWNVGAFWHSAVGFHLRQPYRPDGLGFIPWIGRSSPGWVGPGWLQFAVLGALFSVSLWRCPRTPAGFVLAVMVSFFGFFCFSTQAFANYYFFVLGAQCCALGAMLATAGAEA